MTEVRVTRGFRRAQRTPEEAYREQRTNALLQAFDRVTSDEVIDLRPRVVPSLLGLDRMSVRGKNLDLLVTAAVLEAVPDYPKTPRDLPKLVDTVTPRIALGRSTQEELVLYLLYLQLRTGAAFNLEAAPQWVDTWLPVDLIDPEE